MSLLIPPQVVANLVMMSRAQEEGKTALLIEGHSDARLYRRVTDQHYCRIFACGSRSHAESTLTILKAGGQPGVLVVVDADTDHITGTLPPDPDVIVTHTRDAEGIILSSDALQKVLIEFDLSVDAFGPEPEKAAIAAAVPLAYIRHIVEREKWQIQASQIDFSVFHSCPN